MEQYSEPPALKIRYLSEPWLVKPEEVKPWAERQAEIIEEERLEEVEEFEEQHGNIITCLRLRDPIKQIAAQFSKPQCAIHSILKRGIRLKVLEAINAVPGTE